MCIAVERTINQNQNQTIRAKCGARSGIIRHLKKIGMTMDTLKAVYTAFIRPVLEYASNCFHTSLTAEQSHSIERLQQTALKMIYGLDTSYERCLELSGPPRLDSCREEMFERFTTKCYDCFGSPRKKDRTTP